MKYLLLLLPLAAIVSCAEPSTTTRARVDAWKAQTAADDEAIIPTSRTLSYPSADEWARISKRVPATVTDDKDDE